MRVGGFGIGLVPEGRLEHLGWLCTRRRRRECGPKYRLTVALGWWTIYAEYSDD
jgi:hypothetical protein